MADQHPDRGMAQLMGAHLLALSKATAVYQAELAKIFLGLQDEEERVQAGPAYRVVRDLEKLGVTSSLFDQSPEGAERRLRSWSGSNAVLLESWLSFMEQPWRAYWRAIGGDTSKRKARARDSDDS